MQLKPLALIVASLVATPAFAADWTDVFTLSGSAEANYIITDNGDTTESTLDRALLLNIDAAKKIKGGMTLGGRISQKITGGETDTNKVGFGSREAYVSLSGDFGTVKAGRTFLNSYLTLDWPYGQVGFWGVAEAGQGKVTGKVYLPNTLNYQSPNFGAVNFTAQHGWDNAKHNKDSVYDLAANINVGKGTVTVAALGSKPKVAVGAAQVENTQQFIAANISVSDALTLRGAIQSYKQTAGGATNNKGSEYSLGLTYGMGDAGYIKAAYMNQNNTGEANDFQRVAVQYGRDIGGGAEWYARLMKQSPKHGKDVNQFLTGVWIGF